MLAFPPHIACRLRGARVLMTAGLAMVLVSCASSGRTAKESASHDKVVGTEQGKASYYGVRCNGTRTASGMRLRDDAMTAAHRRLPFGTPVRVTNLENGKSEVVTITDRGPFKRGRVIDVTVGVARRLDFVRRGVVPVKVEVLERQAPPKADG